MHSKIKGNLGETAVALHLMKLGYHVFSELGDASKIDLIVPMDDVCIRIQVKAVTGDGKVFGTKLRSSGPGYTYKYTSKDVDLLAVYDMVSDTIAWISVKELEDRGRSSIKFALQEKSLSRGPEQNMVEDYSSFEAAISKLIPL